MMTDNQLSGIMDIKDLEYRYDRACKRLLSFKAILARILKGCVREFRDADPDEIEYLIEGEPIISEEPVNRDNNPVVEGLKNEDAALTEGTVVYDILFYAYTPNKKEKKLIINVEAQNSFNPGYPLVKRGLYYCSRLISAQYGTEFKASEYGNIKKVISIWICSDPPQNKRNTLTRFSVKPEQLIGRAAYKFKDYDLFDLVMVCLDSSAFKNGIVGTNDDNSKDVIRFLTILITDKLKSDIKKEMLKNEYNIKMTEDIDEEVFHVCNLSYGIAQRNYIDGLSDGEIRGIAKGIAKGKAEGKAEGKEEGKNEGKAIALTANVKTLMKNLNLTLEKALEALGISAEEYESCLVIVGQNK